MNLVFGEREAPSRVQRSSGRVVVFNLICIDQIKPSDVHSMDSEMEMWPKNWPKQQQTGRDLTRCSGSTSTSPGGVMVAM